MEETTSTNAVNIIETIRDWALTTGVKIVFAIIVLLISFRIVTVISRRIEKKLEKSGKFDKTLVRSLSYAGRVLLKIVIASCMVGYLGVDTSGIAALIASLGVGIGLAVNGALSNFAGGILLLVTRPFKVGD